MLGEFFHGAEFRFASRPIPEDTAPERLTRLLAAWREQCTDGAIPSTEHARFEPFAFALGHMHVIDACDDGTFFYRIFGTASSHPLDYHKRKTSMLVPAGFRELVEADYRECIATAAPTLREIEISGPNRTSRFRRVLLPYGMKDGRPTLLVAGIDEDQGLADILRDPAFRPQPEELVLEAR